MTQSLFVTGAHTDVGKTFVACGVISAARARGRRVEALKPVVSGFSPDGWAASDPGRLLAALGRAPTIASLDAIAPLRFGAPISPPMAARREGSLLWLARLLEICIAAPAGPDVDLLVIEGAGGVMSPIAEDATNLDLMAALGAPVLLVGGSYLGAISHTLTALACLCARGLSTSAVVVSQSGDPAAPDFAETVDAVRSFAGACPVVAAARDDAMSWIDQVPGL